MLFAERSWKYAMETLYHGWLVNMQEPELDHYELREPGSYRGNLSSYKSNAKYFKSISVSVIIR